MKKLALRCGLIMLAMLMSVVTLLMTACSSEDKLATCHCQSNVVKMVENIVGTMHYDNNLRRWYISYCIPFAIDAVDYYYPRTLDQQFKQENLKVVISGDIYMMDIEWNMDELIDIGGLDRYCIDILNIEKFDETAFDQEALNMICKTWNIQGYFYNNKLNEIDRNSDDIFKLTFSSDGTFSGKANANGLGGKFYIGKNGLFRFTDFHLTSKIEDKNPNTYFVEEILPIAYKAEFTNSDVLRLYFTENSYFMLMNADYSPIYE